METLSFIPLGGIGDVTKNMYLYIYRDEVLIVDCGLGFPDETMPGVDLLIPDTAYLKNEIRSNRKKIVGMVLTHGHEDHIGALPYILPGLPTFPIYGSTLTAALANEKLSEFETGRKVETFNFDDTTQLGNFKVSFIRVTHSIIDSSHLIIKTPIGNFYHGADFKFDKTPVDGKPSEIGKIEKAGGEGIICLFSDCLGAERAGFTPSEAEILNSFEQEFKKTVGRVFVTTYSSNISRLNQAIEAGLRQGRKICFIGRSLLNSRDVGVDLNYMKYPKNAEILPHEVRRYKPAQVLLLVAGSQAQEESALVRIANNEDRDVKIEEGDTVIFSADFIPGNEISIYALIDTIAKKGARVIYSDITDEFHVSGHGSAEDLKLLIKLTSPKFLLPIGGTYRQMVAYQALAKDVEYSKDKAILIDNGQEIKFSKNNFSVGVRIPIHPVFVDEITGEPIEHYIVFDRIKISHEGLVIVIAEIDSNTGRLASTPDIFTRGFKYDRIKDLSSRIQSSMQRTLRRQGRVTNWPYYKKLIERVTEQILFREGRQPLVVPVVLEV